VALTHLGHPGKAVAFLEQARPLLDRWVGDQPWWRSRHNMVLPRTPALAGQLAQAAEVASQGYAAALTRIQHFGIMLSCIG
jgi:hypothetical protein